MPHYVLIYDRYLDQSVDFLEYDGTARGYGYAQLAAEIAAKEWSTVPTVRVVLVTGKSYTEAFEKAKSE